MKAMSKVLRGEKFRGLLESLLCPNPDRPTIGRLIGYHMEGQNPSVLAAEFRVACQLRRDIEKPAWHQSLRLPKGEKIAEDKWLEIADEYMLRMGFTGSHLRCYVLFDYDGTQCVHIVASRISLSGELYYGRNEHLISTRVAHQLEKDFGLQPTKGLEFTPEGKIKRPAKRQLTKNEINMAQRTGARPAKLVLQERIDSIFPSNLDVAAFIDALNSLGVNVRANTSTDGKLNGFSFNVDGHIGKTTSQPVWFKGSSLGDGYKISSLAQRGLKI